MEKTVRPTVGHFKGVCLFKVVLERVTLLVILLPACLSVRLSDYWHMYVCLSAGLFAILFCPAFFLFDSPSYVSLLPCLSARSVLLSPSTSSLCLPLHSPVPVILPLFPLSHFPPPHPHLSPPHLSLLSLDAFEFAAIICIIV